MRASSRRPSRRVSSGLAMLLVSLSIGTPIHAAPAWAQAPSDEPFTISTAEEAELQFLLGVESFAKGDYRTSLGHLLASNRLSPNKNVLYNIARCYEQLKQYDLAYQSYAGYVSREELDDGRRRDALDAMTALQPQVALVLIETTPPGSAVYIDRTDLGIRGTSPITLAVPPGEHKIIVAHEGYRPSEKTLSVKTGSTTQAGLALEQILAKVRVSGTPEGATIRNLDGENPETLPVLGEEIVLPLGKSTLEIARTGYAPVQIVVEPKDGLVEKYAVQLEEQMDEKRILELFTQKAQSKSDTRIYGYIDSHFEQVATTKSVNGQGQLENVVNPPDFDVANLHIMVQGTVVNRFRYFVNLAAPGSGGVGDDPITLRNAWVEAPIAREALAIRFGKLYRRFGIYNEILDAVPTFIGIEPPEMFDKDHLLLTRTTNLMAFGRIEVGLSTLEYSVTTGADERAGLAIPIGADLRLNRAGSLTIGSSGYWSGGTAEPTRAVGEGPPLGGVQNWMAEDEFYVYGGFTEILLDGPIFQVEYWQAHHDAKRDVDAVTLLANTPDAFIGDQRSRFIDSDGSVIVERPYTVRTGYVRTGYEIPVGRGNLTPYAQFDYYSNPEVLFIKDYGGDDEAGLSDTGAYVKLTSGLVVRPVPPVALKVDGSAHIQPVGGETFIYPEIRINLAYLWELNL